MSIKSMFPGLNAKERRALAKLVEKAAAFGKAASAETLRSPQEPIESDRLFNRNGMKHTTTQYKTDVLNAAVNLVVACAMAQGSHNQQVADAEREREAKRAAKKAERKAA